MELPDAGGAVLVSDGGLATELESRGHDLSTALWSARLLVDAPEEIAAVDLVRAVIRRTPPTSRPTAATNRRVLFLHIVQAAVVYINTLMIQDVLDGAEWSAAFTPADYRGLTPLIWAHVAMQGEFKLNMNSRLTLGAGRIG